MRSGYWVRLAILVLCAAFSLGGTFVCKSSTGDDDFHHHSSPAKQNAPSQE
jgi:hypothetical protein